MKLKISLLKAICLISIAFVINFMLNACSVNKITSGKSTKTTSPIRTTQQNSSPTHFGDGDIPFTYKIVHISKENHRFNEVKCQSTEDIRKYLGDDAPTEYNDTFFNDNTLVLHFEGGTTSSVRYDIKSVSRINDNILIDIDYEFPSIVTADISYCCIIVELKNSYLNKDDKVGINFDSSEPARTYPLGLVIISLKG